MLHKYKSGALVKTTRYHLPHTYKILRIDTYRPLNRKVNYKIQQINFPSVSTPVLHHDWMILLNET